MQDRKKTITPTLKVVLDTTQEPGLKLKLKNLTPLKTKTKKTKSVSKKT